MQRRNVNNTVNTLYLLYHNLLIYLFRRAVAYSQYKFINSIQLIPK